jgi:bifunctional ADP-heptose synthase (sugar kinase/adenylyltransferase)
MVIASAFYGVVSDILKSLITEGCKQVYNQINDPYSKLIDTTIAEILEKHDDLTLYQIDTLFTETNVGPAIKQYLEDPDKLKFKEIFSEECEALLGDEVSKKEVNSIICEVFEILEREIREDEKLREKFKYSLIKKIHIMCEEEKSIPIRCNKLLNEAEENLHRFAYEKAEKLSQEAYKLDPNNERTIIIFGRSILSKICNSLESKELNVLVIGDIMLDRTLRGDTATNTIVGSHNTVDETYMLDGKDSESYTLGGVGYLGRAFSVIVNKVFMIIAVGNDCEGNILRKICDGSLNSYGKVPKEKIDVNIEFLDVCSKDIITTTKIYFIKGAMKDENKKTIRFDREERYMPSTKTEETGKEKSEEEPGKSVRLKIFEVFNSCLNNNINCVVIDDYEKGVITKRVMEKISKACDKRRIGVYVDPKYNWNRYKGLKIKAMIPNLKECQNGLCQALPSQESLKDYNIDELIIKKDKDGAEYSHDKKSYTQVKPLKTISCRTDVGCGTVFDAYFITSRLCKYSLEESVLLANCAAGLMTTKELGDVVEPKEVINKIATEKQYFVDNKDLFEALIKKYK